jgi:UDP-N-acetylglucosamine 4,6-dehydratase
MTLKRVVVTGGTGSLGTALVTRLLNLPGIELVTVLSRDELKQYDMQRSLRGESRIDFALGDVRDVARLSEVFASHDTVIHTAALKQVVFGEHNPMEYILTNINGTINVVEASVAQGVGRTIVISTDKAASAVNLYGGTKFVADKYVTRTATDSRKVREAGLLLSVIRFGNFLNSRGSVIPLWRELAMSGQPVPVTDPRMTRFWLPLEDAADFVLHVFNAMRGGEIFVPRCRAITIGDLVSAVAPNAPIEVLGRRIGEKMHEELVSELEVETTVETQYGFIIFEDGGTRHVNYTDGKPLSHPVSSDEARWAIDVEGMRSVLARLR